MLLLAGVLVLTGCRETSTSGPAIYVSTCSACHGVDLTGSVGGSLAAGSEYAALSDLEYQTVIREGTVDMPANRSLSDEQLDALIAYIRSEQAQ